MPYGYLAAACAWQWFSFLHFTDLNTERRESRFLTFNSGDRQMTNDKSESNVVKDQINNTSDACGAELPQKQMIKTNTQKQQTASFKKIMDYRDRINSERACLLAEDLSSVVYIYENRQGKPCAIAYRGRAKKEQLLTIAMKVKKED